MKINDIMYNKINNSYEVYAKDIENVDGGELVVNLNVATVVYWIKLAKKVEKYNPSYLKGVEPMELFIGAVGAASAVIGINHTNDFLIGVGYGLTAGSTSILLKKFLKPIAYKKLKTKVARKNSIASDFSCILTDSSLNVSHSSTFEAGNGTAVVVKESKGIFFNRNKKAEDKKVLIYS